MGLRINENGTLCKHALRRACLHVPSPRAPVCHCAELSPTELKWVLLPSVGAYICACLLHLEDPCLFWPQGP